LVDPSLAAIDWQEGADGLNGTRVCISLRAHLTGNLTIYEGVK